ncbi:MAG: peptidase M15, partial [Synergistaceae bacterium]|nr:peptidase M15 [Synergistaceae bacterium]
MRHTKFFAALMLVLLFVGAAFAETDPMDSSDFVNLSDVVPDAILEIRYYSTYNFVGDRIEGYEAPIALLTREAADALKRVSDELITKG